MDDIVSNSINGKNITIYGEGNYLRDYIYIDDVVSAFKIIQSNVY
jgi:dTDP-D-glucose 4,6-dehydratase